MTALRSEGNIVSKVAEDPLVCRRQRLGFPSARAAWGHFLQSTPHETPILLPAYVGFSPREGSGVLDPVSESGRPCHFYEVDGWLRPDLGDLHQLISDCDPSPVVLIVHYFGQVWPETHSAIAVAKELGATVVEDEAHAMLSDVVLGASGRAGHAAFWSLHKILPLSAGGVLLVPGHSDQGSGDGDRWLRSLDGFDFHTIADRRLRNLDLLYELLLEFDESVAPLWSRSDWSGVPQTLPITVDAARRDQIYTEANARGFGVVSLYHTLVDPVAHSTKFAAARDLSRRILNLPVHQDADPASLVRGMRLLQAIVAGAPR